MTNTSHPPNQACEIHIKHKDQVFIALVDAEDYPIVARFTWQILWSKKRPYAMTRMYNERAAGRTFLMHHLILASSAMPDHIDGHSLNNQKHNLRPATHQTNGWNRGKNRRGGGGEATSEYKGVCYRPIKGKDRWLAILKHVEPGAHKSTGKVIRIGYFSSEVEAAKAYNKKVQELRGAWAWTNPIPEEL